MAKGNGSYQRGSGRSSSNSAKGRRAGYSNADDYYAYNADGTVNWEATESKHANEEPLPWF